ncbi:MAG: hypothetical protein WD772_07805 [Pseudohongiellaceae bacterium]
MILARLEETGLSIWLRESSWGFFLVLIIHSLAMGMVVGINFALGLRLLGIAPKVPVSLMLRFFPFLWAGLVAIVFSGLMLLLAYPAKALTNWVFYFKLLCIGGGLYLTRYFALRLRDWNNDSRLPRQLRLLAVLSIVLWAGSITAGRFLAYTHTVLLASRFY